MISIDRAIEDYNDISMQFKRNQVEEAIFRTLNARDARVDELRFRLKRLLVTDRRLGRKAKSGAAWERQSAFYSHEPPGSGIGSNHVAGARITSSTRRQGNETGAPTA
jgi:hypothetical protein